MNACRVQSQTHNLQMYIQPRDEIWIELSEGDNNVRKKKWKDEKANDEIIIIFSSPSKPQGLLGDRQLNWQS